MYLHADNKHFQKNIIPIMKEYMFLNVNIHSFDFTLLIDFHVQAIRKYNRSLARALVLSNECCFKTELLDLMGNFVYQFIY